MRIMLESSESTPESSESTPESSESTPESSESTPELSELTPELSEAFAMAPWHFCHGTCVATVATTKIEK